MCTIETVQERQKRLQWQCRRGMLEIDILLKRYLSTCYLQAGEEGQRVFEALLSENDQNLFLWLTGKESPPEKYGAVVEALRQ